MRTDFISTLSPIIKKAGEIMLSAVGAKNFKQKQGDVNYVTEYDEKVQAFLIEEIKKAYPNATFIAEEKDNDSSAFNSELCFIIDPIDGTTNFIRDYKTSSISIGVFSKGVGVFGAILNPYLDELFTAEKAKGAYLNGKKITVSDKDLNQEISAVNPTTLANFMKSSRVAGLFFKVSTFFSSSQEILLMSHKMVGFLHS